MLRCATRAAFVASIVLAHAVAQGGAYGSSVAAGFPLVSDGGATAAMVVSAQDAPVVRIAAEALAADVKAVTGRDLRVVETLDPRMRVVVIAGTIGRGGLIDDLREDGKIDVSAVDGQWESFAIRSISRPGKGIDRALVVAGSDPRGTAYGILELSRRIGVSPWIWWADVPPVHQASLYLHDADVTSMPPSVRYRGIFINDEDFGFRVWAAKTQDTVLKNIGPKTYARVFELLLRLRANTLWPAMHPGSRTFNASPENAKLAARYSIVMGSSHAEPMLRNNVAEWDHSQRGEWDYEHNKVSVLNYWDERVAENEKYENIYTMGMRGIHDSAMPGSGTAADKAKLVEKIVADQRAILAKHIDPEVEKVPQVLWMYKEVLELYRAGMTIPRDITLGWTDDNYGYIRQLSDSRERDRSGGSGVYYHVSYWGAPHDYLWLCTTPPELIREEMSKAYDYGARRIWILNVGDIKPAETDIDYFMQLAWDEPGTVALSQEAFLRRWVGGQFPAALASRISEVLDHYYRLNFARKPEMMGFNRGTAPVQRTAYNPVAFGDQNQSRRAEFSRLAEEAEAIGKQLPAAYRDAYFELVLYPVRGAALMNDKQLLQDEAALEAAQGRTSAAATQAKAAADDEAIQAATAEWEKIKGGKWDGVMSAKPHGMAVFGPVAATPAVAAHSQQVGVALEGYPQPLDEAGAAANVLAVRAGWFNQTPADPPHLAAFNLSGAGRSRFLDLFNPTQTSQTWSVLSTSPWIHLDQSAGELRPGASVRVTMRVDESKLTGRGSHESIQVKAGEQRLNLVVRIDATTARPGVFVEDEGSISIAAMHPARQVGAWQSFSDLSPSGEALGIADKPGIGGSNPDAMHVDSPQLDYSFETKLASNPTLDVLVVPTFPANAERKGRFAVSVDDTIPLVVDTTHSNWEEGVLRNSNVLHVKLPPLPAGLHTLRYWSVDPGVLVQHFVLHTGPGPNAYPVPPETQVTHEPF